MNNQFQYWDNAGKIGYGNTYFSNRKVERHNLSEAWNTAIEAADRLNLKKKSTILELGCGDGEFAIKMLSARYLKIDAYDYAPNSIKRALSNNRNKNIHFEIKDITKMIFPISRKWHGVFMMGILHHVKTDAAELIRKVAKISSCIIVLEPNGNSPFRKAFEIFLPSYKKAGEKSFRMEELEKIFKDSGFSLVYKKHILAVPWFTPEFLLPIAYKFEKFIQKYKIFDNLHSIVALGFKRKTKSG
jgi:2-polyprenyl-3-methyl-5-hydroxy-6-metoxy-1,4-benzoquinol methylase